MDICKLNCAEEGSILPRPTGNISIAKTVMGFYPENLEIIGFENYPIDSRTLFEGASDIFRGYLHAMRPEGFPNEKPEYNVNRVNVQIAVADYTKTTITLATDESYSLTISTNLIIVTVSIQANNFFGARHALETLSQLITFDEDNDVLQITNTVQITDRPAYRYRGVLLDTARNFYPIPALKKLIDGLSHNKLNMFHWHITESNSFPMEVQGHPNFTLYGAPTPRKVYTIAQMKELVEYARVRGVKIIGELDIKSHSGFGWQWGTEAGLGELVLCLNKPPFNDWCLQPPCGQLNYVNDNVYELLGDIFTSMLDIFDNDMFHMGGDELLHACYNDTQEVLEWMAENGVINNFDGFMHMWGRFQMKTHEKIMEKTRDPNLDTILWTSELTSHEYINQFLPTNEYIVQIWTESDNQMIADLLNDGYRTIFSNVDALYLDCGFQAWIGNGHNWCSPYKGWQTIYDNNPHAIYARLTNETAADEAYEKGLLLGGEAAMWSEQADQHNFESRIFPRASALAERLWSNPPTSHSQAEFRMVTQRERMAQRGLRPDALQPEFCSQYQNHC